MAGPGVPQQSVSRAIYGTILVTSVVAYLSEDGGISDGELLYGVALTALVFWLAHVYAESVAERFARDSPLTWRDVREVAAREWPPMAQAAGPAVAALGLAWAGALSRDAAVDLAIGLGVAALFAWGYVIARRSQLSLPGTVGAVAINGAFGLAIVVLKVTVG